MAGCYSHVAHANPTGEDVTCPFRRTCIGTWEHLSWQCISFQSPRSSKPESPLSARFGWPEKMDAHLDVFYHLTAVAKFVTASRLDLAG